MVQEDPGRSSPDRNAIWVGLRTLRQRPTVAGRTEAGDVVYEVRSVRLLLEAGASHFSRLVECSKCGRPVPGSPVLGPADLERAPNPVFCSRCSATAPAASPLPPPAAAAPRPPVQAPVEKKPPASPPPVVLPAVERAALATVSASVAEARSEVRALARAQGGLADGLAAVRTDIARLQQRLDAGDGAAASAPPAHEHDALAEALQDVRARLASLERRLEEQSAALTARLEAGLGELARAQEEMEGRLSDVTARVDTHSSKQHVLEQRLAVSGQEAARAPRRPPDDLLQSLEEQLRAADDRIAQTLSDSAGD